MDELGAQTAALAFRQDVDVPDEGDVSHRLQPGYGHYLAVLFPAEKSYPGHFVPEFRPAHIWLLVAVVGDEAPVCLSRHIDDFLYG